MSKFDNAFSGVGGAQVSTDTVDYASQNKALVGVFKTQGKAISRVGIVSGIIDLGLQKLPDAAIVWNGTSKDEAAEIVKNPNTYFEDGFDQKTKAACRFKRWPQKPQQAVAITVDFPQFKHDWGGDIGEKPIRFLLNGEFTPKGKKPWDAIVGRTYDLKETTKDFSPKWSLATNSLLYKLAIATEVCKEGTPFSRGDIGKLIGKAALFEARLWLEGTYLQEKITFKGAVPEGMSIPVWDDDMSYFVRFDKENEESSIVQLRKAVKNTIKAALNYEESQLAQDWDSVMFKAFTPKQDKPPVQEYAEEEEQEDGVYEDDIPF